MGDAEAGDGEASEAAGAADAPGSLEDFLRPMLADLRTRLAARERARQDAEAEGASGGRGRDPEPGGDS